MSDVRVDPEPRRSPLMYGGIALAVVAGLLLISTCRQREPVSDGGAADSADNSDVSRDHCDRILEGVLDGLRPERVGITSDSSILVDALNNWLTECAPPIDPGVQNEDRTLRESLLPAAMFEQTQLGQFIEQDAGHIRNQLLARGVVDVVTAGLSSDHDRARELFYYVVRNVDLLAGEESGVPLTPYDILVLGLGTARDRAWVFADLLLQLKLDAVILQPRSEQGEPTSVWFVGVLLPDEGVALYDCRLGLPVPALDDDVQSPLVQRVATLRQARDDERVLRQLDRGESAPFPVTAADLGRLSVQLIADSSLLAPRMEELQAAIDDRGTINLYNGLGPGELRPSGLVERVTRVGADGLWISADIGVWDYPESRWRQFDHLTSEQERSLTFRYRVMDGPIVVAGVNETEQGPVPIFAPAEKSLLEGRVLELLGRYDEARSVFLNSRLSQSFSRLDPEVGDINRPAADWAEYWVAASQYELGDYRIAGESLARYLKGAGMWSVPARYLLSLSLAQQEQWDAAADTLAAELTQAPQYDGDQWLAARWRRLGTPPATPPTDTKPPAEDVVPPSNDPEPDSTPTRPPPPPQSVPEGETPRTDPADESAGDDKKPSSGLDAVPADASETSPETPSDQPETTER